VMGDRGGQQMKVPHGRGEVIDIIPSVDPTGLLCRRKMVFDPIAK
jgi:hypothetical protein